jgi:hypothetical protein
LFSPGVSGGARRPVGQSLALSIPLEDELERLAHDLLEISVQALVRQHGAHLFQLSQELRRHRDVEAALVDQRAMPRARNFEEDGP